MKNHNVTCIYFSPGGTTKQIALQIGSVISDTVASIDLLKRDQSFERDFSQDETLIVALPVFSGRIPEVCVEMLHKVRGNNTSAVAVVVYGNRDFEDALLELSNILIANGFNVVGGCAAVARHSIFPKVANNRPDSEDQRQIATFASQVAQKIDEGNWTTPSMPGNSPYRKVGVLPLNPTGSKKCTRCGVCSKICPVKAIPENNPRQTKENICINCTACIYACPQRARRYKGLKYKLAAIAFSKKHAERKVPSFFVEAKQHTISG